MGGWVPSPHNNKPSWATQTVCVGHTCARRGVGTCGHCPGSNKCPRVGHIAGSHTVCLVPLDVLSQARCSVSLPWRQAHSASVLWTNFVLSAGSERACTGQFLETVHLVHCFAPPAVRPTVTHHTIRVSPNQVGLQTHAALLCTSAPGPLTPTRSTSCPLSVQTTDVYFFFFRAQTHQDHSIRTVSKRTGLFLGPQMTGEALKGGRLAAEVMSREGFECVPAPGMPKVLSMITAIGLGSRKRMSAFCRGVQSCQPIGSYIQPVPGEIVDIYTCVYTCIYIHMYICIICVVFL